MPDPLSAISTKRTHQSGPIPMRTDQVANNAGGYVFKTKPEQALLRFLILGTDGGTYYAGEAEHTAANAQVVFSAANDPTLGLELVDLILSVSQAGRAPRQNPTLFALAVCCASAHAGVRERALAVIPRVCRTGTHLFTFVGYVENMRGWGRGLRRAISGWYTDKPLEDVAYQIAKYGQREGWSHRDLLLLSRNARTGVELEPGRRDLFSYVSKPKEADVIVPEILSLSVEASLTTDIGRWAELAQNGLTWEMLPSEALNHPEVWEALLPAMPIGALVRQLPTLTRRGLLEMGSQHTSFVVGQLTSADLLRRGRVHPLALLTALKTYAGGRSLRGSSTWKANPKIIDALNDAFYESFGFVERTGKRTLVALDISGSMDSGTIANSPLTPREASAALTMLALRTENECEVVGFTADPATARNYRAGYGYGAPRVSASMEATAITHLGISARQRLDDVIGLVRALPLGRTDCAAPLTWAMKSKIDYDVVEILTDNETWAGPIHVVQALDQYEQQIGHEVKVIANAMTATEYSVADPTRSDMLDVVGFDLATPNLIAGFARGEF